AADRPGARRGVSSARSDRAAVRLDRPDAWRAGHRACFPRIQRRPASAADDRRGRYARGSVRGLGRGDPTDLLRGGDGVSTDPVETATERREVARGAGASDAQAQPSEQELRAAYEAELSRVSSSDMI